MLFTGGIVDSRLVGFLQKGRSMSNMYTEKELKVITDKLRCIKIDESHLNAYGVLAPCILGEYYSKQHNSKKALENYLKCIEEYRSNTDPYPYYLKESIRTTYYNACYSVGAIYYGENNDIEKGITYLKEAADDGKDPDACNFLGGIYIDQGKEEAISYLEYAAKNGHTFAQNSLGRCYEFGVFVAKNIKKAKRWYKRAADSGDTMAKDNLRRLTYVSFDNNGKLILH